MGLFNKKTEDDKKATVESTGAKVKASQKKSAEQKSDKIKTTVVKKAAASELSRKDAKNSNKKANQAYRFLRRPIISEKATVGAADGKYIFEVSIDANKVAIKKAIQEVYGVLPIYVNIMNKSGKNISSGRRHGRTKNIKKAVVTLKKGDSIKLYEGI